MEAPVDQQPWMSHHSTGARVCVVNLGCKVNRVESDCMESAFVDAGATLVPEADADIVVVNTCGVTGEAQGKTRKTVRHAAAQPRRPLVAVTGCVANLFPDELAALAPNVHVYPNKSTLAAEVLAAWQGIAGVAARAENAVLSQPHGAFRSRRGIKVQDGCDNRCTYCIVWQARGPVRSEPLAAIEQQVRRALSEGANEIVLSGINLGRFCAPDETGQPVDLAGLLDRICALGPESVRASSIEPPDLTPVVVGAMARHGARVAAHLHLPLQAGSDTVLARMGRHYITAEFAAAVAMARDVLPQLSLSTDVIVGFPGETDEEFAQTLAFCRSMAFSKMHVFRYSARPGTPAAAMDDQVDPRVARERSEALHALATELRQADARSRVGTCENVLVEYVDPDGSARGTSASYHDVIVPRGAHECAKPGLIRCSIESVDEQGRLVGRSL